MGIYLNLLDSNLPEIVFVAAQQYFPSLLGLGLPAYHRIMEDEFTCIGVCTPDPESGACVGCDRPLTLPALIAYNERKKGAPATPQPLPPEPCKSS